MLSLFLTILLADITAHFLIPVLGRIKMPRKKRRGTRKKLASVIPLKKVD
jgi:hypothetical protein